MTAKQIELNIGHFSDVHGIFGALPKITTKYDMILISGDLTNGREHDKDHEFLYKYFAEWLDSVDCDEIHAIPGNHDMIMQHMRPTSVGKCKIHLDVEVAKICGIDVFFTPWTRLSRVDTKFTAFTEPTEIEVFEKHYKDGLPKGVSIIVSHAPPAGVLDTNPKYPGVNFGSNSLSRIITNSHYSGTWNDTLQAVLFGHIHTTFGERILMERTHSLPICFINGCVLDDENKHRRGISELSLAPDLQWNLLRRNVSGNKQL